jgi:peptidoglycan/xylan/chitin deacetylase (PgdA/CDA1 family)
MLNAHLQASRRRGAILCFHSVTTPTLPAEGTSHVSVKAFTSFIRVARRLGELVPLSELARRHAEGRSTAGLIAVTFDDAYAAVLTELKDVIARQAIPIAVFVVTGTAVRGARYWWDRIDDLFPRSAPERWRAFETACGVPDAYRRGQPREHGPLRPLRQWLLAAFAGRWPDHLEPALAALEQEIGYQTPHRSMTGRELDELSALPWVEIGVHTISHPVLPLLPDDEIRQEIAISFSALRERFPRTVPILAAPYGLYDERTIRSARSVGMTACLTLDDDLVDGGSGVGLPRFGVGRGHTPLTLGLRLLGVRRLLRHLWDRQLPPYPALPSPTT